MNGQLKPPLADGGGGVAKIGSWAMSVEPPQPSFLKREVWPSLVGHRGTLVCLYCSSLLPTVSWCGRAAPGSGRFQTTLSDPLSFLIDSWLWLSSWLRAEASWVRPSPAWCPSEHWRKKVETVTDLHSEPYQNWAISSIHSAIGLRAVMRQLQHHTFTAQRSGLPNAS